MRPSNLILLFVFVATGMFASCIKKKNVVPPGSGRVSINFMNTADGDTLRLGSKWYVNQHGDSFKVNKFSYYITNIRLNGPQGDYAEPMSYHLIEQPVYAVKFDSIPQKHYTSVTFLLGVDSLHNVTGDQKGVLHPAYGMFRNWSEGYIMWKFEGMSTKSPQIGGSVFLYGQGYTGANNVVRTITLNFPQELALTPTTDIRIKIGVDVQRFLSGVNFAETNAIMEPSPAGVNLANNFASAITLGQASY